MLFFGGQAFLALPLASQLPVPCWPGGTTGERKAKGVHLPAVSIGRQEVTSTGVYRP